MWQYFFPAYRQMAVNVTFSTCHYLLSVVKFYFQKFCSILQPSAKSINYSLHCSMNSAITSPFAWILLTSRVFRQMLGVPLTCCKIAQKLQLPFLCGLSSVSAVCNFYFSIYFIFVLMCCHLHCSLRKFLLLGTLPFKPGTHRF